MPERLDEEELADWRAREKNSIVQEISNSITQ